MAAEGDALGTPDSIKEYFTAVAEDEDDRLVSTPDGTGRFRAQMAVYVKPNGLFGIAYMAAIRPFRHLLVYPPMLQEGERAWRAGAGSAS